MTITRTIVVLSFAAAATAAAAQSLNVNGAPNYGSNTLEAGFAPDPRIISVVSGGSAAAQSAGSGCRGFVSENPDYRLNYVAGSYPLIISVASAADTTLVINAPDGKFHCDDDGGVGALNPSIRFDRPVSGRYEIWVGSYRAGTNERARLHISEVSSQ